MLSWMLRVRIIKLAYAAADIFNLLGCVCDCGSFLFFFGKDWIYQKGDKVWRVRVCMR